MRLSRRPLFFLVVVITVLVLLPATPATLRWVNFAMAGLAMFWFVLFTIEEFLSQRRGEGPPPNGRPQR